MIYSQSELTQGKAPYDDSEFEAAITHFSKAVPANPWCEQGFYYRSRSYNQIDDYANALRSAESATRLNSNDEDALSEQAWALNGLGTLR